MSKTITLRLPDNIYQKITGLAKADNRPISNFIETMTLRKIEEESFVSSIEMHEIGSNEKLLKKLKKAHTNVKQKKGMFVEEETEQFSAVLV